MSFGDLSKLYKLIPTTLKKKIASSYEGLDESLLENWIQCASVLRNLCAHNSRIYARGISIPTKIETNVKNEINKATKGEFNPEPRSFFSYLLAIRRISLAKTWNLFVDNFERLLKKYDTIIELKRLGMPKMWKDFLGKK